jgi:hypothetical protein
MAQSKGTFSGWAPQRFVFKKTSQRGRKLKHDISVLQKKVEHIPLHKRTTFHALAGQLDLPLTTVFSYSRNSENPLVIRRVNTLKPVLTPPNKLKRLEYVLNHTKSVAGNNSKLYHHYNDTVFVDEKWFYCSRSKERYLLAPGEKEPARSAVSRRNIQKVMFLCAVTRPRYDAHRKVTFDGKIGIWPIVAMVPAKRDSKNRKKGTLEAKHVNVDSEVYEEFLFDKLLPAIASKCPASMLSRKIYLQQDNAPAHKAIKPEHWEFELPCAELGIHVEPVFQPPNSPDLNILDLCFFNSLQSYNFHEELCNSKADLVKAVNNSFSTYCPDTLNRSFLTLQAVMNEILKVDGGNNFKLPHVSKEALIKEYGRVPQCLEVSSCNDAANTVPMDAPTYDTFEADLYNSNNGTTNPSEANDGSEWIVLLPHDEA